MTLYTVHKPPDDEGADAAERFRLIGDRFSMAAFLVPLLWALRHGLWTVFFLYLVFLVLLVFAAPQIGGAAAAVIALGVGLLLGLEAPGIRRFFLERRGWARIGEARGRSRRDAETRFIYEWARTWRPPAPPAPEARGPDQALVPRRPEAQEAQAITPPRPEP